MTKTATNRFQDMQDSWHIHLGFIFFLSDGDKAVVLCFVNNTITRPVQATLERSLIAPFWGNKLRQGDVKRVQQRSGVPLFTSEQALRLTTHKTPCYLFAGWYSGQKRRFASRLNGITQTGNEIKASAASFFFFKWTPSTSVTWKSPLLNVWNQIIVIYCFEKRLRIRMNLVK